MKQIKKILFVHLTEYNIQTVKLIKMVTFFFVKAIRRLIL